MPSRMAIDIVRSERLMNRKSMLAIARDELARYEYRCRTVGASLAREVEAHREELLRNGVNLPGTSPEYRAQAMAEAWAYAERGETKAAALTHLSRVLIRVLRAIGGEPIWDKDAVPPTVRQAKVAMHNYAMGIVDEPRESITLDRDTIEHEAKKQGIFEDTNGRESQPKES